MKKISLGFVLMFVGALLASAESLEAQSKSRGGSGARSSGASRGSAPRRSAPSTASRGGGGRSGGGRSAGRSGGSGSRTPQLTPAQRQQLQIQQALVALGEQRDGPYNQQQNQLAVEEAQRDFSNLQSKRVFPNQLGSLTQLYRLDGSLISQETRTVEWPETLSASEYESTVSKIDMQIRDGKITNAKTAKAFLKTLGKLDSKMNSAAAAGDLELEQYVEARVFITGLANEIRATDLLM